MQISPLFIVSPGFHLCLLNSGTLLGPFCISLCIAACKLFQDSKQDSCATYLIHFSTFSDCYPSLPDIQYLTSCCFMIVSSFVNCCKCHGRFGPCYSISIESGSQKISIFSSLIISCAIRYSTRVCGNTLHREE